jgi:hypothetical protein
LALVGSQAILRNDQSLELLAIAQPRDLSNEVSLKIQQAEIDKRLEASDLRNHILLEEQRFKIHVGRKPRYRSQTISFKIKTFQVGEHLHISDFFIPFEVQIKLIVYFWCRIVQILIVFQHLRQVFFGQN